MAELKEKQSNSGSKGEKAELEKKINELASELSKVAKQKEEEKTSAINEITNRYENQLMNYQIDSIIGSKQLPGQFPKDIEMKIAREFVEKKLAEKGAIVKNIEGKLFERLSIVYFINPNIFNKNSIFENSLESFKIIDCFVLLLI